MIHATWCWIWLQFNNIIFLNENQASWAQFEPEKRSLFEIYVAPHWDVFSENFSFSYKNLEIIRYCLRCSVNYEVIYVIFGTKPKLQNDHSFLIEINFYSCFLMGVYFYYLEWKIEGWRLSKLTGIIDLNLNKNKRGTKIWARKVILVHHFWSHLLKMQKS